MVKAQVKGLTMHEPSWFSPSSTSSSTTWSEASSTIKTSSHSHSPGPSLKRARSLTQSMTNLPTIPRISGDLILTVFTHRSLRFPGAPRDDDAEYGDSDRLAVLGEKALDMAVTDALWRKRPMLKAEEIQERREHILNDATYDEWITSYKLRDKLRCTPDVFSTLRSKEVRIRPSFPLFSSHLSISQETSRLLFTYVGAVYAQSGQKTVQNWIGALVDPHYEPASPNEAEMDHSYTSAKKVKIDQYSSPPEPAFPPPPPPPTGAPPPQPPPPPVPPMSNPLAPALPQTAFLPLFNQTATQRRLPIEYPATFSGPPHAGKWSVRCLVNGIEKGSGTGASKQLAKEEAARMAYFAMGWAPRGKLNYATSST
ncbi:hypothetical protein NLI96_g6521 [Meripilus lineatus]|uniref:DRBM domain-containing protein n=1 Tax=Meripilus lineatus TaxID=2056292 RepID=A0AAD5V381_9APHY|nr:hypothetical protein NLI96_g6521 [Physisporinus lineatus]